MVQETPERIQTTRIEDEMRVSYLDYAMSVIVSRALPDVRDGLKPVQRRILFGMQELGVGPNSALKKTARVVGEVMGKFHPHGDQAIYDTLVRMAQDFTMRYPLITGQGNFGSVDGDPPAQMRYTEARLAPIASELLADLDRDTVDFQPNFDDSVNEPVVLPSRIPNLLLNGASGIAVGMATNVPPHNLKEICDALTLLIDRPEAGIDELMEHVQGPDFPTRGRIFGREAIRQAYASGRGKVTMQGVITHEQTEAGRIQLIVTELPYQVNKSTLIQRIADLVRNKRIEGVSDLRDESDRDGMRIVIELSRAGTPAAVEAQLFKLTALQSTFAVNMLALVDGQPKTVSLKEALEAFIDHRRVVIRRRSEFDLSKARERAHILEGLLRAIEHLDWVIATIRASDSADAAKAALMAGPDAQASSTDADDDEQWFSERQAQAVLDMQLRRLAALERQRIEDEHAELAEQIAWLEDLLAHPEKIDGLIKDDCAELKNTYGDERATQAFAQPAGEISAEDLVPHQRIVVTVSDAGYMKRVPLETYRRQGRGGRGVTGAPTRDEDAANHLVVCDTHDSLLFFTQQGRVYSLRGYEAPEATRQARGIPLVNLVEMERHGPRDQRGRRLGLQPRLDGARDRRRRRQAHAAEAVRVGAPRRPDRDEPQARRQPDRRARRRRWARRDPRQQRRAGDPLPGRLAARRLARLGWGARHAAGGRRPRGRAGDRQRRRGSAAGLGAWCRQADADRGIPDEGPRRDGHAHLQDDRPERTARRRARRHRRPGGHPRVPRGHRHAYGPERHPPAEPDGAGRRRDEHRRGRRPRRARPDRPRRRPVPERASHP